MVKEEVSKEMKKIELNEIKNTTFKMSGIHQKQCLQRNLQNSMYILDNENNLKSVI